MRSDNRSKQAILEIIQEKDKFGVSEYCAKVNMSRSNFYYQYGKLYCLFLEILKSDLEIVFNCHQTDSLEEIGERILIQLKKNCELYLHFYLLTSHEEHIEMKSKLIVDFEEYIFGIARDKVLTSKTRMKIIAQSIYNQLFYLILHQFDKKMDEALREMMHYLVELNGKRCAWCKND